MQLKGLHGALAQENPALGTDGPVRTVALAGVEDFQFLVGLRAAEEFHLEVRVGVIEGQEPLDEVVLEEVLKQEQRDEQDGHLLLWIEPESQQFHGSRRQERNLQTVRLKQCYRIGRQIKRNE